MDEVREIYTKQVERLQRERDTALLAASQMDDPNNINAQLPPGVEISNKKVSWALLCNLQSNKSWNLNFSVQTATEMRWLNVHFAGERHTVRLIVNGKTG